jgi:hypothetical protein
MFFSNSMSSHFRGPLTMTWKLQTGSSLLFDDDVTSDDGFISTTAHISKHISYDRFNKQNSYQYCFLNIGTHSSC